MQAFLETIRLDLWAEPALQWLGRLSTAAALLLLGVWLARRAADLVRRGIQRRSGDLVLATFLRNTTYVALLVLVAVGALDRAGVPTGSLLAALGAAGLAIGLALKDSLGNLASGVLLIVTRPFRAGDVVEIGGSSGTVERIDLLQTVLVTADNKVIAVPNAQVMGSPIVNATARSQRRVDLLLQIAHDADLGVALAAIDSVLRSQALVLAEPAPQIVVLRLAETGVELGIRPWVATTDLGRAPGVLLALVKQALDAHGIALATPRLPRAAPAPAGPP